MNNSLSKFLRAVLVTIVFWGCYFVFVAVFPALLPIDAPNLTAIRLLGRLLASICVSFIAGNVSRGEGDKAVYVNCVIASVIAWSAAISGVSLLLQCHGAAFFTVLFGDLLPAIIWTAMTKMAKKQYRAEQEDEE